MLCRVAHAVILQMTTTGFGDVRSYYPAELWVANLCQMVGMVGGGEGGGWVWGRTGQYSTG